MCEVVDRAVFISTLFFELTTGKTDPRVLSVSLTAVSSFERVKSLKSLTEK